MTQTETEILAFERNGVITHVVGERPRAASIDALRNETQRRGARGETLVVIDDERIPDVGDEVDVDGDGIATLVETD